jgi:hypothetical protein
MMVYREGLSGVLGVVQVISGLVLMLLLCSPVALAKKTDVIVFKNGDRVTGEIKNFEHGQLQLSTNAMGTVMIKWDNIDNVISNKSIQIELESGASMMGSLSETQDKKQLQLKSVSGETALPMEDVVYMRPVKKDASLWERLDGSITFGLNYAKGSKVGQSHMGAMAILREAEYQVSGNFNYNLSTGSEREDTERFFLGGAYQRTLSDRWFWLINSNLDRNEELGIDLRFLGGTGGGRYLWQTNFSELRMYGGVAASRELRATDANATQLEGQFGGRYSIFQFNPTKTDLNATLQLFPGITESGRWRGDFRTQFRWEMIKDFFWDLTYYYTFDNRPPPGAAENDTGINTSLGYIF